jgi:hypothetical protein
MKLATISSWLAAWKRRVLNPAVIHCFTSAANIGACILLRVLILSGRRIDLNEAIA